jgi:hypothetical protein
MHLPRHGDSIIIHGATDLLDACTCVAPSDSGPITPPTEAPCSRGPPAPASAAPPKRLPRQHGSSVKFTIRQRNDAGIFVKVSKMTITIYQNITVKFNDEEYTYSECWTYNTTKSVVDEFHMPEHLFENVLNFRYQTLTDVTDVFVTDVTDMHKK